MHNKEQRRKEAFYNSCYFVLNDEREKRDKRIDERVDVMLKNGLLEEVQKLKNMGYHRGMVSMQGLGYKELLAYLDGDCTFEDAVYFIKRDSRHFAKRQLTWFRREKEVLWIDKSAFQNQDEAILHFILEHLKQKGII